MVEFPLRREGRGGALRREGRGRRPCPGGVAAVRALRSHWPRTRKSRWRLRGGAAALLPFPRGDGGGGAAAAAEAAAAGAAAGGWRAGVVTVPVGTVLLVGPVALHPLRPGAFLAYLPAALRARPR